MLTFATRRRESVEKRTTNDHWDRVEIGDVRDDREFIFVVCDEVVYHLYNAAIAVLVLSFILLRNCYSCCAIQENRNRTQKSAAGISRFFIGLAGGGGAGLLVGKQQKLGY